MWPLLPHRMHRSVASERKSRLSSLQTGHLRAGGVECSGGGAEARHRCRTGRSGAAHRLQLLELVQSGIVYLRCWMSIYSLCVIVCTFLKEVVSFAPLFCLNHL